MLKLEIKLNSAQLISENKYSPEALYAAIDNAFARHHFRKEVLADGTICYYGNGGAKDYGTFGMLITTLKDKEWFMAYLTKWLWCNSDDGETEDDYTIEDILYHYTKKASVA